MKERVSAFIDGESGHQESLDIIKALAKDHELRKQWHRYHVYGHVLRDEMTSTLSADFTARVSAALAHEPVQLAPAALRQKNRFRGPAASLAIAASLVAVAVLIFSPATDDVTHPGGTPLALAPGQLPEAQVTAPIANYDEHDLIVANSKNENVRERINRLLVEHNQYNPASDMTGIMPYSRFVGYNPGKESH